MQMRGQRRFVNPQRRELLPKSHVHVNVSFFSKVMFQDYDI